MKLPNLQSRSDTVAKVGVLGGIGVDASVYFYRRLIDGYRKQRKITSNTDYPQIFINSAPLPELHLEEHDTPEILGKYAHAISDLSKNSPDFLVMVCNTIHLYLDEMSDAADGIPILDLSKIVNNKISSDRNQTYCILGTGLTISRNLFGDKAKTVSVSKDEYELLCKTVVNYNNGGSVGDQLTKNKQNIKDIIEEKIRYGATKFVYACTEVSEIMSCEDKVPAIDTLELQIAATIDGLTASLPEEYYYKKEQNT